MATPPRQILPGAKYLVTRRCTQRQFLLTPSPTVNAVFKYILALKVAQYGILLHGFSVMSNHFHLVLTDPESRLPDFLRDLDALIARSLNLHHGRRESFFSSDKPNIVRLVSPGDVISKLAYTLTNPVTSRLVSRRSEWPGAASRIRDIGGPARAVRRPDIFFSKRMPEKVELRLLAPLVEHNGHWVEMSADELTRFRQNVRRRAEAREQDVRQNAARRGRRFLGADSILRQSPFTTPRTASKPGITPRIAAADKRVRIAALENLRGFIAQYYRALKKYRKGTRDVEFPCGTFKMRALFGVRCVSMPLPAT